MEGVLKIDGCAFGLLCVVFLVVGKVSSLVCVKSDDNRVGVVDARK